MTEHEKELRVRQIDACLQFGDGKVTEFGKALLSRVHDGELTHDDARRLILEHHGVAK